MRGEPLAVEEKAKVRQTIEAHAELLAEAEHNLWMVERMLAGWRYAKIPKKDLAKKLHPMLIPYAQLPDRERDKDRRLVKGRPAGNGESQIPDIIDRLEQVNYRISFASASPSKDSPVK